MAQHPYDFRAYRRGVSPPDFTFRTDFPPHAVTLGLAPDDAARNMLLVSKYSAEVTATVGSVTWNAPEGDTGFANQEIYARVRIRRGASAMGDLLVLRGGATFSDNGYYLSLDPVAGGNVLIRRRTSGVYTTLGTASGQAWQPEIIQNVRFRINGTSLQAKWWQDGAAEPGSWAISITASSHATGWAGIAENWTTGVEVLFLNIATNGDTASGPSALPRSMVKWSLEPTAIEITLELLPLDCSTDTETPIWLTSYPNRTTNAGDYPASVSFRPVVKNAGSWNASLSADLLWGGLALRAADSEILLENGLGEMDDLLDRIAASDPDLRYTLAGRRVVVRGGEQGAEHRFFEPIFTAVVGEGEPPAHMAETRIPVASLHPQLAQALEAEIFTGVATCLTLSGTAGVNGYVTIPSHTVYDTTVFAVTGRFALPLSGLSASSYILGHRGSGSGQFLVTLGFGHLQASAASSFSLSYYIGADGFDGRPHTWGLAVYADIAYLIYDDEVVDSEALTTAPTIATGAMMALGSGVQGKIWNVTFYAVPPVLADLLTAMRQRTDPVAPGVGGYWPCDDGIEGGPAVSTVVDRSATANNGTVLGTQGTHYNWAPTFEGSAERAGTMPILEGVLYNELAERAETARESFRFSDGDGPGAALVVRAKGLPLVQPADYLAATGAGGGAARFDGVDDYLSTTSASCPAGALLVEIFMRLTAAATSIKVIGNYYNGADVPGVRALSVGADGTNVPRFAVINDAGTLQTVFGGTLVPGTLARLAGAINLATGRVELYLDGELVAQAATSSTHNTTLSRFELGRLGAVSSFYFGGAIDEVRIWDPDLFLPDTNVHQHIVDFLYSDLAGTELGLVDCWKFREHAGAPTAANTVTTGPALTVTGATFTDLPGGVVKMTGSQNEPVCVETSTARPEPKDVHVTGLLERNLVNRASLVRQVDLEDAGFAAARTLMPWPAGFHVPAGGSLPGAQLIADLLGPVGGFLGQDQSGRLVPGFLQPPCTPGPYSDQMLPVAEFMGYARGGIWFPPVPTVFDDQCHGIAFWIKPWAPFKDGAVASTAKFPSSQTLLNTMTPAETGGLFLGFDAVNDGAFIFGHPGVTNTTAGASNGKHYTRTPAGVLRRGEWNLVLCDLQVNVTTGNPLQRMIRVWHAGEQFSTFSITIDDVTGTMSAGGPLTIGGGYKGGYHGAMATLAAYLPPNVTYSSGTWYNAISPYPPATAVILPSNGPRSFFLDFGSVPTSTSITEPHTGAVGTFSAVRWAPKAHWNLDLLDFPVGGPKRALRPAWRVPVAAGRNGHPLGDADFGAVSASEKIKQKRPFEAADYVNRKILERYREAVVLDGLGKTAVGDPQAKAATPALPTALRHKADAAKVVAILAERFGPHWFTFDLSQVGPEIVRLAITDEVWITSSRLDLSPTEAYRVILLNPTLLENAGAGSIGGSVGLWGGSKGPVNGTYFP